MCSKIPVVHLWLQFLCNSLYLPTLPLMNYLFSLLVVVLVCPLPDCLASTSLCTCLSPIYSFFPLHFSFFLSSFHFAHGVWSHWSDSTVWTAVLGLQLLVTVVVHHLKGAGGRLPLGSAKGSQECVFGLPHMNTVQQTALSTSAWWSCHVDTLTRHSLSPAIALLGCLAQFLCVWWKWFFSGVLSLAWSFWVAPIWNSEWTSEAAPSGNHSCGLGLSKQWELGVICCRGTFWSCSRTVSVLTPDSQICPLNFSSMSVIVLLVLPGARTQPKHQPHSRFQLFLFVVSLAALVGTVACFTQILVFFFTKDKPHRSLSWPGRLPQWVSSLRLLLLLNFLTLLLCSREELLLLRL